MKQITIFIFGLFSFFVSQGQEKEKTKQSVLDFKRDSIDYLIVDTTSVFLEEEQFDFEEAHQVVANDTDRIESKLVKSDSIPFIKANQGDTVSLVVLSHQDSVEISHADSLVMDLYQVGVDADTNQSYLDSLNISPLVHDLLADSLYWMGVAPWFNVFDSMTVNPYKIDGAKYKDTTTLVLYDSLMTERVGWSMPLTQSHISSNFGHRRYRWHYGTDLTLNTGDSVFAVFDGVIRICKYNSGGFGNYIMVRHHNGLETLYGHLSKQLVEVGQHVKAGELIGLGGSTGRSSGPHLHFEVRYQGNAIDPALLYDFEKHTMNYIVWDITPAHFKYIRDAKEAVYHRVKSGDTLGGIAVRYRTTISRICKLNNISRNTILRIGRRLRVR